jgi:hypothetical protein
LRPVMLIERRRSSAGPRLGIRVDRIAAVPVR